MNVATMSFHTHSAFSDGRVALKDMAAAFRGAGFTELGFTDHFAAARAGTFDRRMNEHTVVPYIRAARECGVVVGLEAEILKSGEVAIGAPEAELVDYVIGGLHTMHAIRFFDDRSPITDAESYLNAVRTALIHAIESGRIDAVAHPTKIPEALHGHEQGLLTPDWRAPLIEAAARRGVAFDVNEDSRVPDAGFVRDCREAGVRLLIGSDAHTIEEARPLSYVPTVCDAAGIREDDLYIPQAQLVRR